MPDTLIELRDEWTAPIHSEHYDEDGNETFVEKSYCSFTCNCAKQLQPFIDRLLALEGQLRKHFCGKFADELAAIVGREKK